MVSIWTWQGEVGIAATEADRVGGWWPMGRNAAISPGLGASMSLPVNGELL